MGGGGSASVHAGIHPPGVGLETPRCGPGDPPGVDLETPLARPLNFPPGCGPGDPPGQTPQLPPGYGSEDPPAARHAGMPPPMNRMTDRCKNITLPQTSFAGGND